MYRMLSKKKDKNLIEVTIEINLFGIDKYLVSDDKAPGPISFLDWEYKVLQTHKITVLPSTENIEFHYHQNANKISHNFNGVHTLSETGNDDVKQYCKSHKIYGELEWQIINLNIFISLDRKFLGAAPLIEATNLQTSKKTSSSGHPFLNKTKEVITVDLGGDDTEANKIPMYKTIDSKGAMYSNKHICVVYEIPDGPVLY